MKGSLHTDELMREVTSAKTGLRTARRISHVFIMDVPTHADTLFITDAAINIFPDLDAKRDIIQNAIDLHTQIGLGTPRVGILSAVETVTTKIPQPSMQPRCARWPSAGRSPAGCSMGRSPRRCRNLVGGPGARPPARAIEAQLTVDQFAADRIGLIDDNRAYAGFVAKQAITTTFLVAPTDHGWSVDAGDERLGLFVTQRQALDYVRKESSETDRQRPTQHCPPNSAPAAEAHVLIGLTVKRSESTGSQRGAKTAQALIGMGASNAKLVVVKPGEAGRLRR